MTNRPAKVIRVFSIGALILLAACGRDAAPTATTPGIPPPPSEVTAACTVTDPLLDEISGMTASVQHPGVLWMHNDSGDATRVFAVDAETCRVRAKVAVTGFDAVDMEAIGLGRDADGDWQLWLGDIGDNLPVHDSVTLAAIPEPTVVRDQTVASDPISVTYSDGPRNAEALLVEPTAGGRIWIVTKSEGNTGGYYRVTIADGERSAVADFVGPAPTLVTDGAFNPTGQPGYVLRTYFDGRQFQGVPPQAEGTPLGIGFRGQAEAVTYSADGRFLYTISEGRDQPLLMAPLPLR